MKLIAVFCVGILFGLGITISGMANPAKVVNFFDIAGTWDPSLIFVMGGALAVTALGYRLIFARPTPILADAFHLPGQSKIDTRLIGGAATFGVGWGIAGYCPGGALPIIGIGGTDVLLFLASLVCGIYLARGADRWRQQTAAQPSS